MIFPNREIVERYYVPLIYTACRTCYSELAPDDIFDRAVEGNALGNDEHQPIGNPLGIERHHRPAVGVGKRAEQQFQHGRSIAQKIGQTSQHDTLGQWRNIRQRWRKPAVDKD